jgi:hypothetical protein
MAVIFMVTDFGLPGRLAAEINFHPLKSEGIVTDCNHLTTQSRGNFPDPAVKRDGGVAPDTALHTLQE